MSIAQVNPVASTAARASQGGSGATLGKEDFLQLLVVQLQKQDPLNPQDPAEFTAQLTQFSSLEQLISMNQALADLAGAQARDTWSGATALIGRTANVQGDSVSVEGGAADPVAFTLAGDATEVSLAVYDAAGRLVEVIDLGGKEAGSHAFQWDAVDKNGLAAADGEYRFDVVAQDAEGNTVGVQTQFTGVVTGVYARGGVTYVEIDGREWPLDAVVGVRETA